MDTYCFHLCNQTPECFKWIQQKFAAYSKSRKFLSTSSFKVLESRKWKQKKKKEKHNNVNIHSASHCECREGVIHCSLSLSVEPMTILQGKCLENRILPKSLSDFYHAGSQIWLSIRITNYTFEKHRFQLQTTESQWPANNCENLYHYYYN